MKKIISAIPILNVFIVFITKQILKRQLNLAKPIKIAFSIIVLLYLSDFGDIMDHKYITGLLYFVVVLNLQGSVIANCSSRFVTPQAGSKYS